VNHGPRPGSPPPCRLSYYQESESFCIAGSIAPGEPPMGTPKELHTWPSVESSGVDVPGFRNTRAWAALSPRAARCGATVSACPRMASGTAVGSRPTPSPVARSKRFSATSWSRLLRRSVSVVDDLHWPPPSATLMASPFTPPASSEARNAMSSAMDVRTQPGNTALDVTPYAPASSATKRRESPPHDRARDPTAVGSDSALPILDARPTVARTPTRLVRREKTLHAD
jgi:hypothetical protein